MSELGGMVANGIRVFGLGLAVFFVFSGIVNGAVGEGWMWWLHVPLGSYFIWSFTNSIEQRAGKRAKGETIRKVFGALPPDVPREVLFAQDPTGRNRWIAWRGTVTKKPTP